MILMFIYTPISLKETDSLVFLSQYVLAVEMVLYSIPCHYDHGMLVIGPLVFPGSIIDPSKDRLRFLPFSKPFIAS